MSQLDAGDKVSSPLGVGEITEIVTPPEGIELYYVVLDEPVEFDTVTVKQQWFSAANLEVIA